METLGQTIRKIRKEKNINQEELAKKLGYANKSVISKFELDKRRIPASDINKWAKALGVSPVDLLPEEYIKNQAKLDARILRDSDLKKMIEKYYNLEIEKQKIVRDLIDTLSK